MADIPDTAAVHSQVRILQKLTVPQLMRQDMLQRILLLQDLLINAKLNLLTQSVKQNLFQSLLIRSEREKSLMMRYLL